MVGSVFLHLMRLDEMLFPLGDPFFYFPEMVTRFNISVSASVLAGYLAWHTRPEEQDGWRSVTMSEVQIGTGLTVKEQASARKQLVEAGLIEEFYARLEHKIKIRFLTVSGNGHLPKEQMAILPNSKSIKDKEIIREDKKSIYEFDVPLSLSSSSEFMEAWYLWLKDRRERKKPVTSAAASMQLRKLEAMGPARAVDAIEASISNGWQGIFEPRLNSTDKPQTLYELKTKKETLLALKQELLDRYDPQNRPPEIQKKWVEVCQSLKAIESELQSRSLVQK